MSTFKENISKISKSIKIRGGKSNFTLLSWCIDYFQELAGKIKSENLELTDEDLEKRLKEVFFINMEKYVRIRIAASEVEPFNLSYYLLFSDYDKIEEKTLEFTSIKNTEEANFVVKEFEQLYNCIRGISRGNIGVNSMVEISSIINLNMLRDGLIFPFEMSDNLPSKVKEKMIRESLHKLHMTAEGVLKSQMILNIMNLGYFLEEFGLIQRYMYFHRSTFSKFGLADLIISPGDGKIEIIDSFKTIFDNVEKANHKLNADNVSIVKVINEIEKIEPKPFPDKVTFRDFFKVEYLKSLPVSELIALNCFWQNKLSKDIKNIFTFFILCDSLNLWQRVLSGEITFRNLHLYVSDKQYKMVLEKLEYLILYCKNKHSMCKEDTDELFKYEDNEKYSSKEIYDNMDYEDYFSEFPNQGSLNSDVKTYMMIYRGMEASYFSKNLSIYSLIKIFNRSKECKNYGVVQNESHKDKNVLIYFDYTKLIAPFGVHIGKKQLLEFLVIIMHNSSLPLYSGFEDMFLNDEFFSSNILVPMTKKQSKSVKNLVSSLSEKNKIYKFVAHICLLANGKVPNHLKVEKSGKKVFVKKYIDMRSGIIFSDTKDSFFKLEDFDV